MRVRAVLELGDYDIGFVKWLGKERMWDRRVGPGEGIEAVARQADRSDAGKPRALWASRCGWT